MTKSTPEITIARVYQEADKLRGYSAARTSGSEPRGVYRVLVDRLWPRGIKKADLSLDAWFKDVAPSAELRKWFGHDPEKWPEFRRRYLAELRRGSQQLSELQEIARNQPLVLLYGARDEEHNHAIVLREHLQSLTNSTHR